MRFFLRLLPWIARNDRVDPPLFRSLEGRVPEGGGPGLAGDAEAIRREEEATLAIVRALHGHRREPAGMARRTTALLHAIRRGRLDELEEALAGLAPLDALDLVEKVRGRGDLDRQRAADAARELLGRTRDREVAAGGLALLSLGVRESDAPLLALAARLGPLSLPAARAASALGGEAAVLLLLLQAESALGLGRALVVGELLRGGTGGWPPKAPGRLLGLVAAIEEEEARAWAAVPLLEAVDAAALLRGDPGLAEAVASCLEAASLGGWRGGPGPGLGRLPGAIRAAEAILQAEGDAATRERVARAVLDSHPSPPGKAYLLARELLLP